MADLVTLTAAVLGVLVGGGLKAWEAHRERKLQAKAILNALVAEVDTIKRLINAREYIRGVVELANHCRALVEAGSPDTTVALFTIPVSEDYFQAFNSLVGKIGTLHPYHADRLVRFYMLIKAAKEDFSVDSPWQKGGTTAAQALQMLEANLMILRVAYQVGDTIAGFVDRSPPKGIVDPLLNGPVQFPEDPLALNIDVGLSRQAEHQAAIKSL